MIGRQKVLWFRGARNFGEGQVQINPGSAQTRNNLGISLARMNRFPEAIEQFEQALRIQPDFEQARSNLRDLTDALQKKP